jgi:hypothetical protein
MEFIGGVFAKGGMDFVLVQKEGAGLDSYMGIGSQMLVFGGGDDMSAGRVDVKDAVGFEIEVALAVPEVERTEGFASDDEKAARRTILFEEAAIHHEVDVAMAGSEMFLQGAELAEGLAMIVLPIQFNLRGVSDPDVESDATPLDALGGVREQWAEEQKEGNGPHERVPIRWQGRF